MTVGEASSWIWRYEQILDREARCPPSGRLRAKAEYIDVIVYPHEWPHVVSHDTSHLVELPSSVHPGSAAWPGQNPQASRKTTEPVSYTHLRAHETVLDLVCRLLLEKKKNQY